MTISLPILGVKMTDIVSKPDHNATLVEEGKATEAFQLFLDDIEKNFNSSLLGVNGLELRIYMVANLPTPPSNKSFMVFVSDASGGSIPAFWDGTNWRRVTDRAIIS